MTSSIFWTKFLHAFTSAALLVFSKSRLLCSLRHRNTTSVAPDFKTTANGRTRVVLLPRLLRTRCCHIERGQANHLHSPSVQRSSTLSLDRICWRSRGGK